MQNGVNYKRLGLMIDCSRNAVMKVNTLKKWIDLMSDMGYNTLMLYMEDTYEVDNNPYFGYARGRYSQEELKEIDNYAETKAIEVIPCIQTLAHLGTIFDWAPYRNAVRDCDDILLVDEEKTYELIDNMFASLSKSLKTKHINMGMDEAGMVGRGRYYDLHGDTDKTELLVRHVNRVAEIGKKYGYTLSMWSDMFFRIASKGEYYNPELEVSDDIKSLIPENVELIYWDYYSKDVNRYDNMLKSHKKLTEKTWFAGGFWTWHGFAPHNKFSIEATKAALNSCEKNNIENIFFTLWGDDSAECSKFAVIPSMFYISEYIKGNKDEEKIKAKFKKKFGIEFDEFMLLDLNSKGKYVNPCKYIFFNDLFNGLTDTLIMDNAPQEYEAFSKALAPLENNEDWGYLFKTIKALSDVLALKADLGKRIRKAYKEGDKQKLKEIVTDCKKVKDLLIIFYDAYENQWMKENKGNGFDVQDIRIGGIIVRVEHCIKRLEKYLNGDIIEIEELENTQLDYFGRGTDYVQEDIILNSFRKIFTANALGM